MSITKELSTDLLTVALEEVSKKIPAIADMKYKTVDAIIKDASGKTIFEKKDVLVPAHWSQMATNIAAEKYFIKTGDKAESSVAAMCKRVASKITESGLIHGYFEKSEAALFENTLNSLLQNQYFSFNSPVWFNVGVHDSPQISACFINSIDDSMDSILELCKTEGKIYKYGSGSGVNYSALRGSREALSHGGHSSGPCSFIGLHDGVAGSIKSGGTTRRAAKMVILNADHPDILDFVLSKGKEELKAKALIKAGFNADFRDPHGAYGSLQFQNANHSVRVTDAFMEAVEVGKIWNLVNRTDGKVAETIDAKKLFHTIAEEAWKSGDPGLQFHDTINSMNTLKWDGTINSSNPCSEYLSLDNTSCNLASINLMKFMNEATWEFDLALFQQVTKIASIALDILICDASYPTATIASRVKEYRQIGLGYANLGTLLMASGHPYDSEAGRNQAALITEYMTTAAYKTSVWIADKLGPFPAFKRNEKSVSEVIAKHAELHPDLWREVIAGVERNGLRNSYVTNIAPTGTIGLQMDCETTGIEPELALVKNKKLVGGGEALMVNRAVPKVLARSLGYSEATASRIVDYIAKHSTIVGCPDLEARHKTIFATSLDKDNSIPWRAHIEMMAAVQPHLSGAISKTVNMPAGSTVEDVENAYMLAWKKKLKSVAIYRDGCKMSQPLNIVESVGATPSIVAHRRRLPDDRQSLTHKFEIAGHEGYITVGLHEDGKPGEVFVVISKEGSFVSGLVDAFATMLSIALQYGAPLDSIVSKLKGHSYEPQGYTKNPAIRNAKSITDYLARYLELKFLPKKTESAILEPFQRPEKKEGGNGNGKKHIDIAVLKAVTDAPPCPECGSMMVQNGTCHQCLNCGSTSGCS